MTVTTPQETKRHETRLGEGGLRQDLTFKRRGQVEPEERLVHDHQGVVVDQLQANGKLPRLQERQSSDLQVQEGE
jgi:hypothetical protein